MSGASVFMDLLVLLRGSAMTISRSPLTEVSFTLDGGPKSATEEKERAVVTPQNQEPMPGKHRPVHHHLYQGRSWCWSSWRTTVLCWPAHADNTCACNSVQHQWNHSDALKHQHTRSSISAHEPAYGIEKPCWRKGCHECTWFVMWSTTAEESIQSSDPGETLSLGFY